MMILISATMLGILTWLVWTSQYVGKGSGPNHSHAFVQCFCGVLAGSDSILDGGV